MNGKLFLAGLLGLVLAFASVASAATILFPTGGGTGWGNLQQYSVLLGNGTAPIATTSPSTSGFVLTSNGPSAFPTFQAVSVSSPFPFTVFPNYNATTSVIGFFNGLFSNSTTTINGSFRLPGLTSGTLNTDANGLVYKTATSTPTVTAPITYSGTLGQFISGVSGAFGCTNASSGVTGCLTGTDWNTFNAKENALTFNYPLTRSTNTISFAGLSTSSPWTGSGVAYRTSDNTIGTTATGTATFTSPLSGGPFTVIGTGGAVTCPTCSTATFGYPFTPTANFNTTMSATSTPLWTRLGIYASSTSVIASTTFNGATGNVGIGLSNPLALLVVSKQATVQAPISGSIAQFVGQDGNPLRITFNTNNGANTSGTAVMFTNTGGTAATPSATIANAVLGSLNFRGYGASALSAGSTGLMTAKNESASAFTDTSMPTAITFDTTAVNSVTATEKLRITGSGTVGIGTTSPVSTLGINGSLYANNKGAFGYSVIGDSQACSNCGNPSTAQDTLVVGTSTVGATSARGILLTVISNGTGGNLAQGLNSFVAAGALTGNLTVTTNGGALRNRYLSVNSSTGYNVAMSSAQSAGGAVSGTLASSTDVVAFNAENPIITTGNLMTSYYGLDVQGGTVVGTLTNHYGVYVNDLVSGTNRYGVYQAGASDLNYFAGNVGIGNTTPIFPLTIASTTAPQLGLTDSNAGTNLKNWYLQSSGGRLLIGTTTDSGATTTPAALQIKPSTTGTALGVATSSPWRTLSVTGTVGFDGLTSSTAGFAVCIISASKEIVNAGNTACNTSSAKTKHDVESLTTTDAVSEILKLRPIAFTYNESGERRVGFIAEEVNKIDPRLVDLAQEDTNFPNASGTIYKGDPISVEYGNITALLVKAMQGVLSRLSGDEKKIDAMQQQIDTLNARLDSLEAK